MINYFKKYRVSYRILTIFMILCIFIPLSYAKDDGGGSAPPPCNDPNQGAFCGRCGTINACGTCVGEHGDCTPGETRDRTCYTCGTTAQECSGSCTWQYVDPNVCDGDADTCQELCEGFYSYDWNKGMACCGDDQTDCSEESSYDMYICDTDVPSWFTASGEVGNVRMMTCSGISYASSGNQWLSCSSLGEDTWIGGHHYGCLEQTIGECCGDEDCLSDNYGSSFGVRAPTGYKAEDYYCVTDFPNLGETSWVEDLDITNEYSCQASGYYWTGTKCCSEDDDPAEYYNDVGERGGCWNKQFVLNGRFVQDGAQDVAMYDGQFYGCEIDQTNYNRNNDGYDNINDYHEGGQLVIEKGYCDVLLDFYQSGSHLFCSYNESWHKTSDAEVSLKECPWAFQEGLQFKECCPGTSCWDGKSCVSDQSNSPTSPPVHGNNRCIAGVWTDAKLKHNWDRSQEGYCPENDMCLVNNLGDPEFNNDRTSAFLAQCAVSGGIVGDYFCKDGAWSTRTKEVAKQLLDIAYDESPTDYSLYCDYYGNILNYYDYVLDGGPIQDYLGESCTWMGEDVDCTNNICVLRYGNKVALGVSLNNMVNDEAKSFLYSLGKNKDICSSYIERDDNKFYKCDNEVWYNNYLGSVIYSKSEVTSLAEQFTLYFKIKFKQIYSFVIGSGKIGGGYKDYGFLNETYLWSRLYVSQYGSKYALSVLEEPKLFDGIEKEHLTIKYEGINVDVCKLVDEYNKRAGTDADCDKSGNSYYIVNQRIGTNSDNFQYIWKDLGPKIRLKPE